MAKPSKRQASSDEALSNSSNSSEEEEQVNEQIDDEEDEEELEAVARSAGSDEDDDNSPASNDAADADEEDEVNLRSCPRGSACMSWLFLLLDLLVWLSLFDRVLVEFVELGFCWSRAWLSMPPVWFPRKYEENQNILGLIL